MTQKILNYAVVLLLLIAVAFAVYQMFSNQLPPDPNAPPIVEPRYRK